MPGDFIAVSQFSYGLRLPVLRTKFLSIGEPQRGDIALFRWPVDPRIIFVKRVIGLPGDHLVYKDKVLTINGVKATQKFIQHTYDYGDGPGYKRLVYRLQENLGDIQHGIFIQPVGGETQEVDVTVPAGQYFMMGDNRDDSDDSRSWGYVPEANLIGRAFGVWFSWDAVNHRVNWQRIGHALH
jgi:signal peptidase I